MGYESHFLGARTIARVGKLKFTQGNIQYNQPLRDLALTELAMRIDKFLQGKATPRRNSCKGTPAGNLPPFRLGYSKTREDAS